MCRFEIQIKLQRAQELLASPRASAAAASVRPAAAERGNGHPLIRRHHLNRNTCLLLAVVRQQLIETHFLLLHHLLCFFFFCLFSSFTLPISISNNLGRGPKEKQLVLLSFSICCYAVRVLSVRRCPTVKQKSLFFLSLTSNTTSSSSAATTAAKLNSV